MTEDQPKELRDYISVLRRRKHLILCTIASIFLISVLLVIVLPPKYSSTATILIEEQEIPPDLVRSTVTSYATQRIQVINQRVMTRTNLWQIIDKFDLYERERRIKPREEILEEMRDDVGLEIVSADVIDPRSGRPTEATIAFTLSFDGKTPKQAQNVTNELVSLYLTENAKTRTQKAEETSDFLAVEAEKLDKKVTEMEETLATFKENNANRLPELQELNMQLMDRTEREVKETDIQLRSLQERKFYLTGQLAQIDPNSQMVTSSGERILSKAERLKVLQNQFVTLSSSYGTEHPDVIKMQREIEALRKEAGVVADNGDQVKELSSLKTELLILQEKYSADHPDIARVKRSIAALEKQLAAAGNAVPSKELPEMVPENPAYITLKAQLESVNSDISLTEAHRQVLINKLHDYEERLTNTPQVEKEYLALSREHENTLRQYKEIRAKLMEAQVAQELEKESKGERFTLIEPALLPEVPSKPNRLAILFLGMVFSIAGGLGAAAVAESMDDTIRSPRAVFDVIGMPPLAVIPYIETAAEIQKSRRNVIGIIMAVIAGFVGLLALVHFLWKPLDVIWFTMMRKISVIFGF